MDVVSACDGRLLQCFFSRQLYIVCDESLWVVDIYMCIHIIVQTLLISAKSRLTALARFRSADFFQRRYMSISGITIRTMPLRAMNEPAR